MEATQQQLNVGEIAAAFGTENLVVRLVQLQHQITELEGALAALRAERTEDNPHPTVDIERLIAKEPVKNGR